MRLSFNGITLGGGPSYFLDGDLGPALDSKLDNNIINIPRTDYTKAVSAYISPCTRAFSGTILGTSQGDFRAKKLFINGMLNKTYEFVLTDDYLNTNGTITTYAEYTFNGKIVLVSVNNELKSNFSKFQLQVYCEDPNFYLLPGTVFNSALLMQGNISPIIFPITFNGAVFTLQNIGSSYIYPKIIINGPFTNIVCEMSNQTLGMINNTFTFTGSVPALDQLIITPTPIDPVKITNSQGASLIASTNYNWDALTIKPGTNTLSISATKGSTNANSTVEISYKIPYLGI